MTKYASTRRRVIQTVFGGLTAVAFATTSLPVHAAELTPMTGESVTLGKFQGVIYFTNNDDGYRVVATISDSESGSTVRFSTTLGENQSATISVPGEFGKADESLEISRSGDTLFLVDRDQLSAISD
jgi:hypothetical protein